MLITIEGIDGSGKSTLHALLRESLADLMPIFTREPGATWIGEQVRRAVAERMDPITEALLFTADHAAHLETVVRPALREGRTVVSDRFTDSRYAYQSVTLEGLLPAPMEWLKLVHDGWTIRPDRTFLLVLPVSEALGRLAAGKRREHFEEANELEAVQRNYLMLAAEDPSRFVVIDAQKEKEEILAFMEQEIRRIVQSSQPDRPR
ncbi:MAG: dTMP kinase [Methanomicrobiaceae archaeon]|nr:dTMP kinase [Methanomicrobiaceae archaeon]